MTKIKKPVPAPDEFYLTIHGDIGIDDVKDTCAIYALAEDALLESAVELRPDGEDALEGSVVVYRVTRFVEVKA